MDATQQARQQADTYRAATGAVSVTSTVEQRNPDGTLTVLATHTSYSKPGDEKIEASISTVDGVTEVVVYVSRWAGIAGPAQTFTVEPGTALDLIDLSLASFGYRRIGQWQIDAGQNGLHLVTVLERA